MHPNSNNFMKLNSRILPVLAGFMLTRSLFSAQPPQMERHDMTTISAVPVISSNSLEFFPLKMISSRDSMVVQTLHTYVLDTLRADLSDSGLLSEGQVQFLAQSCMLSSDTSRLTPPVLARMDANSHAKLQSLLEEFSRKIHRDWGIRLAIFASIPNQRNVSIITVSTENGFPSMDRLFENAIDRGILSSK